MSSKNQTRYIKGAIPNWYFNETSPLLVQPDRLNLKVAFLERPTLLRYLSYAVNKYFPLQILILAMPRQEWHMVVWKLDCAYMVAVWCLYGEQVHSIMT